MTDLDRSRGWYAEGDGTTFTPLHTGLDHVSFTVESLVESQDWMRRLDDAGIPNSGIQQMATGPILNFRDPDDIALAFALALPPRG